MTRHAIGNPYKTFETPPRHSSQILPSLRRLANLSVLLFMSAFTDNRFSALSLSEDETENFRLMTPTALSHDKSKTVHIRHKVVVSGTELTGGDCAAEFAGALV